MAVSMALAAAWRYLYRHLRGISVSYRQRVASVSGISAGAHVGSTYAAATLVSASSSISDIAQHLAINNHAAS